MLMFGHPTLFEIEYFYRGKIIYGIKIVLPR